MHTPACPIVELERQTLAAMDIADACQKTLYASPETPDRIYLEILAAQSTDRALGLREATTYAVAASKRGLLLQLLELDVAADGLTSTAADEIEAFGLEGEACKIRRLIALIREGVETIMPEIAAVAA